jgi:ribose transport system ATP-binding protein
MSEVLVEMKNICKQFDGNYILKSVDFTVNSGEVHALIGGNGAGKTTLMKILAGVLEGDSGEIYIKGQKANIKNVIQAQKHGIEMIFHETSFFSDMNVYENLYINREPTFQLGFIKLIRWRKIYNETKKHLKKFNIDIDPTTKMKDIDPGKQKILEVIRAIIHNAGIVIMDEPTAALDENGAEILFSLIDYLKSMGVAIIYISHRVDEIRKISDRISVLRNGMLVATVKTGEINTNGIIKMMVGDGFDDRYPKLRVHIGKEVLRVESLNSNRIKDISFSLRSGEILGIAGLRGSGRTTLAKSLFGAEPYDSGEIFVRGKKIKIGTTEQAVENGICYITQNGIAEGLFPDAEIYKNIMAANHKVSKSGRKLNTRLEKLISAQYIDMLDIRPASVDEKVGNLSAGNQKKVLMAKWLFTNSKVFIFNQPTSNIDTCSKVDIYNILNELVRTGASIILISNELPEIIGMSDRILVMFNGRIVKELQRGEATKEKILYYASGGNDR